MTRSCDEFELNEDSSTRGEADEQMSLSMDVMLRCTAVNARSLDTDA